MAPLARGMLSFGGGFHEIVIDDARRAGSG
jgi:hypothetical protein